MLETTLSSTPVVDPSIPRPSFGHPYADLEELARRLATGIDCRVRGCESRSERRRLQVLAAAAAQIHQCLSNTGVKSGIARKGIV
jgi:hypothetical protein